MKIDLLFGHIDKINPCETELGFPMEPTGFRLVSDACYFVGNGCVL